MAAGLRAPPARGPEPAPPPGSGAPTAVLGAYDEPASEADVSVTSSAAVRLRERLAAALLVLRARSAGDRTGAVSRCSAARAGAAAVSPTARARWNTRVLSWMTWPCAVVCAAARAASAASAAAGCTALLCPVGPGAAAPARRARCLRLRAAAAGRLAMQDLPRGPVQRAQNRAGRVSRHCHNAIPCIPLQNPFLHVQRLPSINCYYFGRPEHAITSVDQNMQSCHFSALTPLGMSMRADSCASTATLIELYIAPCYTERMTCCLTKQVRQSWG